MWSKQQKKILVQQIGTKEWGHSSDKADHIVLRLLKLVCERNVEEFVALG